MGPIFIFFSLICMLGFIYFKHFLKETKGLSQTEIVNMFLNEPENKTIINEKNNIKKPLLGDQPPSATNHIITIN